MYYKDQEFEVVDNCLEIRDIKNLNLSKIEGLDNLPDLKELYLQYNDIVEIENLDNLLCLEDLYLAHNNISKITGLDCLENLKYLNLSHNKISKINPKIQPPNGYNYKLGLKIRIWNLFGTWNLDLVTYTSW